MPVLRLTIFDIDRSGLYVSSEKGFNRALVVLDASSRLDAVKTLRRPDDHQALRAAENIIGHPRDASQVGHISEWLQFSLSDDPFRPHGVHLLR